MDGCKACSKCLQFKSFDEFYATKDTRDKFTNHCRACMRARNAEWNKTNRDRKNERNRKFRKLNPSSHRESVRQWKEKNPSLDNLHKAARRLGRLKACPDWVKTEPLASQILSHYQHAQWLTETMGESFQVDHIIPLKSDFVCGLHVPWNLIVLTAEDNRAKSNSRWPGQLDCQKGRGQSHDWWKELQ